jgi:hypothetical protein
MKVMRSNSSSWSKSCRTRSGSVDFYTRSELSTLVRFHHFLSLHVYAQLVIPR